jgi:hypothetical protein
MYTALGKIRAGSLRPVSCLSRPATGATDYLPPGRSGDRTDTAPPVRKDVTRNARRATTVSRPTARQTAGPSPYQRWDAMKAFTDNRTPDTPDEFWVHDPDYTGSGRQGRTPARPGNIPVVQSDRGGR